MMKRGRGMTQRQQPLQAGRGGGRETNEKEEGEKTLIRWKKEISEGHVDQSAYVRVGTTTL